MSSSKLNVLIVEYDLSFGLELEMLLEELNYSAFTRVDNAADALVSIYQQVPDLILMNVDVKNKILDLELEQRIEDLSIPILYISSTFRPQHYQAAEISNRVGLLTKPVEKNALHSTIQLAVAKASFAQDSSHPELLNDALFEEDEPLNTESYLIKDSYFFKKKDTFHKVKISDICFIKSHDNYCLTHTTNGQSFTSRVTLSKMESMLPNDIFFRPHRQYIVQVDCIDKINLHDSTLFICNHQIPLSRTKRQELENFIIKIS